MNGSIQPKPERQILNIYQRMIEVQKKVTTVMKNEKIEMKGERGYKGVTHDDVAALLHLPLAESGIVLLPNVTEFTTTEFEVEKSGYNGKYIQKWYRTDMKINVRWINADKPDDFIESSSAAFALDTSDKGFAKAYSLALKIVLLKVHLLESRDGEEQRTFENESNNNQPPPKPKMKPSPIKPAEAKAPTKNHVPAPEEDLMRLDALMNEKGITEEEMRYLLEKGYQVEAGAIPKYASDEILQMLVAEDCNSARVMSTAQKMIAQREAEALVKKSDPGEYIITFGEKLKGKRLNMLHKDELIKAVNYARSEIKEHPLGRNTALYNEFQVQATAYLKFMGVTV